MDQRAIDAAAIEAEVDQVRSLGIDALRRRWRMMFGTLPPKALTKDLIARIMAYRIQERAFGSLDPALVKLLTRLAEGKAKPDELKRRLKPGTALIREYGGERHTVTVAADGFVWNGATYSSLSVIAHEITGTKWNGPRFFGLRVAGKDQSMAAEPVLDRRRGTRKHSRSSAQSSRSAGKFGR
jgi:hypothetical protein